MHGFTGKHCALCGSQQATTTYDEDTGYPIVQCDGCGAFVRTDDPPSSPPDVDLRLDVDMTRLYRDECLADDMQEHEEAMAERMWG